MKLRSPSVFTFPTYQRFFFKKQSFLHLSMFFILISTYAKVRNCVTFGQKLSHQLISVINLAKILDTACFCLNETCSEWLSWIFVSEFWKSFTVNILNQQKWVTSVQNLSISFHIKGQPCGNSGCYTCMHYVCIMMFRTNQKFGEIRYYRSDHLNIL